MLLNWRCRGVKAVLVVSLIAGGCLSGDISITASAGRVMLDKKGATYRLVGASPSADLVIASDDITLDGLGETVKSLTLQNAAQVTVRNITSDSLVVESSSQGADIQNFVVTQDVLVEGNGTQISYGTIGGTLSVTADQTDYRHLMISGFNYGGGECDSPATPTLTFLWNIVKGAPGRLSEIMGGPTAGDTTTLYGSCPCPSNTNIDVEYNHF